MPEHVNRETVLRRRDRLREEYDDVRLECEREVFAGDRFEDFLSLARDGYTGGGYAWVIREPGQGGPLTESMPDEVDDGRRALMILHRGGDRWTVPGGGREQGETYEDAAVREVREETGIDCEVTDCYLLRHCVTRSAGDHDERLHTLWVNFDAAYRGGTISIQGGELNGAAWFGEPPARMHPANKLNAARFWDHYETDGDPLVE